MTNHRAHLAAILALAAVSDAHAHAHEWGEHPAILIQRQLQGIDPNTFIVGHPAHGCSWGGHAGFDHPAVTGSRAAARSGIDASTFIVQPPATTTWAPDAVPMVPVIAKLG